METAVCQSPTMASLNLGEGREDAEQYRTGQNSLVTGILSWLRAWSLELVKVQTGLCHFLAVIVWASHLISLSLGYISH